MCAAPAALHLGACSYPNVHLAGKLCVRTGLLVRPGESCFPRCSGLPRYQKCPVLSEVQQLCGLGIPLNVFAF